MSSTVCKPWYGYVDYDRKTIYPLEFRMHRGKIQVGFKGVTHRTIWRNVIPDKQNPDKAIVRYDALEFTLSMSMQEIERCCLGITDYDYRKAWRNE